MDADVTTDLTLEHGIPTGERSEPYYSPIDGSGIIVKSIEGTGSFYQRGYLEFNPIDRGGQIVTAAILHLNKVSSQGAPTIDVRNIWIRSSNISATPENLFNLAGSGTLFAENVSLDEGDNSITLNGAAVDAINNNSNWLGLGIKLNNEDLSGDYHSFWDLENDPTKAAYLELTLENGKKLYIPAVGRIAQKRYNGF